MSEIKIEIPIPSDNEGFILLKCELCGGFFKLMADDLESDENIEIWCPNCGLKSDSYFTDDVIELANTMSENIGMDLLYEEMKKWEKQLNSKYISFKAGKKPKPKPESPVVSSIDDLEIHNYDCCNKEAKIKPSSKLSGSYCPFCGVKND